MSYVTAWSQVREMKLEFHLFWGHNPSASDPAVLVNPRFDGCWRPIGGGPFTADGLMHSCSFCFLHEQAHTGVWAAGAWGDGSGTMPIRDKHTVTAHCVSHQPCSPRPGRPKTPSGRRCEPVNNVLDGALNHADTLLDDDLCIDKRRTREQTTRTASREAPAEFTANDCGCHRIFLLLHFVIFPTLISS